MATWITKPWIEQALIARKEENLPKIARAQILEVCTINSYIPESILCFFLAASLVLSLDLYPSHIGNIDAVTQPMQLFTLQLATHCCREHCIVSCMIWDGRPWKHEESVIELFYESVKGCRLHSTHNHSHKSWSKGK